MRARPPAKLVEQLHALGLATPGQFACARRRVRKLAGKSAGFESVWLDALVLDRVLTLYQASAINRGEATRLRLGPFVLLEPTCRLGVVTTFRAREAAGSAEYSVLAAELCAVDVAPTLARLEQVVQQTAGLEAPGIAVLTHSGASERIVWGAHPAVSGHSAVEWIARQGRLPPQAVTAIARQTAAALERLEAIGLVHGDLSVRALSIDTHGTAVLAAPGFFDAVRRAAGFAALDLPPEAFDSLSPRRAEHAGPVTASDDRFALGALWWHLLAGRSPWPAGDRFTRIKAIRKAKLPNIHFVAPDTPEPLALAIDACCARDPAARPASYAEVLAMLGESPSAQRQMARTFARLQPPAVDWRAVVAALRPTRKLGVSLAGAAVCVAFLMLLLRPAPSAHEPALPKNLLERTPLALEQSITEPALQTPPSQYTTPTSVAQSTTASQSIAQVTYSASTNESTAGQVQRAAGTNELLLPTDRPLRLASLRLVAGQTVRGAGGKRLQISTPPGGIAIDVEDVRFVDVDFVASSASVASREATRRHKPAGRLLHVRALHAAFERCSFSSGDSGDRGLVAIDWNTSDVTEHAELSLTNGRLELKDCALIDVAAGVRCVWKGALALEVANTLHLGPGPLVRLTRSPRLDEPIRLTISHLTLREASSLVELRYDELAAESGRISVAADECVFALHPLGSLLHFAGTQPPTRMLAAMEWLGQGSVISPQGTLVSWQAPGGRSEPVDAGRLRIVGLVKSEVGFAGPARSGLTASRAVQWQVPLLSPDPPGIDESRLPAAESANP